jgi:hypothetical protein
MPSPVYTIIPAGCAALVLALASCASTPVPNEKIAVAQASVQRAEQAGAQELAPVELASARDKLSRARAAIASHDDQPATELAEQANIDARVAEATADQQRAHKAATEFDASMQALRTEAMRNTTQTTQ